MQQVEISVNNYQLIVIGILLFYSVFGSIVTIAGEIYLIFSTELFVVCVAIH